MATKEAVLQAVPKGSRCQEASPLSRESYIPCLAEATTVVYHAKDRKAYFMCAPCADHNIRNRGGILATTEHPDPKPIQYDMHAAINTVLAAEPELESLRPAPTQSITTIKQAELLEYVGLKNQITKMEAELDTRAATLKDLLGANAPVEDGPLTAVLKFEERKSPSWKNEFIDLGDKLKGAGQGEKLAAKVLEKTTPSVIIKLVVK